MPVINENDTTATDEISFGDNDILAAQVAILMNADLLVVLSDVDGLYTKDPSKHSDAELVAEVADLSELEATTSACRCRTWGREACAARCSRPRWRRPQAFRS